MANLLTGTTTPLASIFGSGFLVIITVLASSVGNYALPAMALVCGIAWMIGNVIRFNIAEAEPLFETNAAPRHAVLLEKFADVALVPAYIISVTLYVRILASYALDYAGFDTAFNERVLTTVVIAFILIVGLTKGLKLLEGLERWALVVTMTVIVVMIAAFAVHDIDQITSKGLILDAFDRRDTWQVITVLAGTLIVVQGFETTRYLGDQYDRNTRIAACRNAQIITSIVYLLFVALATPLFHFLPSDVPEDALMELAKVAAVWLPAPLVLAAIFSQFSAATADTIGAAGNIREFTNRKLSEKHAYLLICGFAIALTWTADTLQILVLASRAFALYYLAQCLVALSIANRFAHKLAFGGTAMLLLFIAIFAVAVG